MPNPIEHKFVIAKIDRRRDGITLTNTKKDTREEAVTEIIRLLNLPDVLETFTYTIVETWTEGR